MAPPPDATSQTPLAQAKALLYAGRFGDAFGVFREAVAREPTSAYLRAAFGQELATIAPRISDPRPRQETLRSAEAILLDALALDWQEPTARRALQLVSSALCVPVAPSSPENAQRLAAGDALFGAGRHAEALRCYEQIVAADPSHWTAVKYVGNCYYTGGDMAMAERWFRHAIALHPHDPQAQRFLCDALAEQGHHDAMWEAAYATVAAHPRYWSGWIMLDGKLRRAGIELYRCRLVPAATLATDASGKTEVLCEADRSSEETAAWMVHALAPIAEPPGATAFQRERVSMANMATHLRELRQVQPGRELAYELRMVEAAHANGDLDAAVFLLRYREDFRADFEAWKRTDVGSPPDTVHKVKSFIHRARLRPL
jgi:tetratricopeptide (TPR) repeat protein